VRQSDPGDPLSNEAASFRFQVFGLIPTGDLQIQTLQNNQNLRME
jgi:hypothetical protein